MSIDVADPVRDFYEHMPYPPPTGDLDEEQALYQNPVRRRVLFHRMWPTSQLRDDQEILIAGCGTSQAARYALREPEARITAIDISETSLRHTRNLQRLYNLENLEVRQLRIEDVQELGRSFDQIVCTGVLHHLPNPDLGLCALRAVLAIDGAMHLMVYAPYGRAGIYMMQAYCRLLGIGTSESDLRDLGLTLDSLPTDHPISNVLHHAKDFQRTDTMAMRSSIRSTARIPSRVCMRGWSGAACRSAGGFEQAPYLPQCGIVAS
jgi:SAM-dependent methyltransferase